MRQQYHKFVFPTRLGILGDVQRKNEIGGLIYDKINSSKRTKQIHKRQNIHHERNKVLKTYICFPYWKFQEHWTHTHAQASLKNINDSTIGI